MAARNCSLGIVSFGTVMSNFRLPLTCTRPDLLQLPQDDLCPARLRQDMSMLRKTRLSEMAEVLYRGRSGRRFGHSTTALWRHWTATLQKIGPNSVSAKTTSRGRNTRNMDEAQMRSRLENKRHWSRRIFLALASVRLPSWLRSRSAIPFHQVAICKAV